MHSDYGIINYNLDSLCSYITSKTDTPFYFVKSKSQITYIDAYLKEISQNRELFIVYEDKYIDRSFMEDYTQNYARCFEKYEKVCSRIHFFVYPEEKEKPTGNDSLKNILLDALDHNNKEYICNNNYLGFLVIRPIPNTFIGKLCLKACTTKDNKVLNKEYKVSLFGINLSVRTIAFQEQDKFFSACATSALWSFFHAHNKCNFGDVPSASTITKIALNNQMQMTFPSKGLATNMIGDCINHFGLAVRYVDFSTKEKKGNNTDEDAFVEKKDSQDTNSIQNESRFDLKLFKEYVYTYTYSELPLILGVDVKDKGYHAITILGYEIKNPCDKGFYSHNIKYIYFHDDRVGPYTKAYIDENGIHIVDFSGKDRDSEFGVYKPIVLFIGLYSKVRIPYSLIKNFCGTITKLSLLQEEMLKDEKIRQKLSPDTIKEVFNSLSYNIRLVSIESLKEEILHSNIKNKSNYLTKNWPKYIWQLTVSYAKQHLFDLLFDGTDIEQGKIYLDSIDFDDFGILEIIKLYIKKRFGHIFSNNSLYKEPDSILWGFYQSIERKQDLYENLDILYGALKLPSQIKQYEVKNGEFVDICICRLFSDKPESLQKDLPSDLGYIWVIDKDGFLCIGKENKIKKIGHPTLTGGMPARIGGEIIYDKSSKKWNITPFSGRYSNDFSDDEKITLVDNVINHKFKPAYPELKFVNSLKEEKALEKARTN